MLAGAPTYAAAKSILVREPFPGPLPQDDLDAAKALVAGLDGRHLVIQGPPGTGKTYTAARLIVHLMQLGRRVGITAQSHKVIHNLIAEVELAAREAGFTFRGLKKGDAYERPVRHDLRRPGRLLRPRRRRAAPRRHRLALLPRGHGRASSTRSSSTRPARSRSPTRSPSGPRRGTSSCSATRSSSRRSRRGSTRPARRPPCSSTCSTAPTRFRGTAGSSSRAPGGCTPTSAASSRETSYEGRLHSVDGCARQRIDSPGLSGTGLRWLPVEHEGNRGSSPEEADRIAAELERLIGGSYTDRDGREHRLGWDDVLVVTPYNAQVRCLSRRLDRRARIGTVDKFQGQEAPVVFFSMATSSGDDLPRNLEFLFSRNRLNVAVSRAQSLAVLVASPELLEIRCRTIEQMRMVNALCRFVEDAS